VDVVPSRLELAKKYGATHTINSAEVDLKQALLDITDGEGVTGSIDCTGRPDVVNTLIDSTAKLGVIVSVGVGKVSRQNALTFTLILRLTPISLTPTPQQISSIPSIMDASRPVAVWVAAIPRSSFRCLLKRRIGVTSRSLS
jgi:Zn-dependent alcohol dehydrogenase